MRVITPTLSCLVSSIVIACGSDTGPGPDSHGTPSLCGEAGATPGAECTGLDRCGTPMQNFVKVAFCEHCFARADTHVCEAGTCRALDQSPDTKIEFRFTVPPAALGSQSFTTAALNPVMADGTRLTCGALSSTCMFVDNAMINARNSRFDRLVAGADFYHGQIAADAGSDRLLFIQVTSGVQGTGDVRARGCVSGIEVVSGQTTAVVVDLSPL